MVALQGVSPRIKLAVTDANAKNVFVSWIPSVVTSIGTPPVSICAPTIADKTADLCLIPTHATPVKFQNVPDKPAVPMLRGSETESVTATWIANSTTLTTEIVHLATQSVMAKIVVQMDVEGAVVLADQAKCVTRESVKFLVATALANPVNPRIAALALMTVVHAQ